LIVRPGGPPQPRWARLPFPALLRFGAGRATLAAGRSPESRTRHTVLYVGITLAGSAVAAALGCGEHSPTAMARDTTSSSLASRAWTLEAVSGDSQVTVPAGMVLRPLVVRVSDAAGQPKAGVLVHWSGDRGSRFESDTTRTVSNGSATAVWVLGSSGGDYRATAEVPGAVAASFRARVDSVAVRVEVFPDTTRFASLGATAFIRIRITTNGIVSFADVNRWNTGSWPNGHGTAVQLTQVGPVLMAQAAANGTSTFSTTYGDAILFFTAVVRQVAVRTTMVVSGRTGSQPDTLTLGPDQQARLALAAVDALGNPVTDLAATTGAHWRSSDPAVVAVSETGVATGGADGVATVSTEIDARTVSAPLRVWTLDAAELAAGFGQVCARLTDGEVACWGARRTGSSSAGEALLPELASLGTFSAIDNNGYNGCGLRDGQAYCWGWNDFGQLGTNAFPVGGWSPQAVPVAGGLQFAAISTGDAVTCGLTPQGKAYCWGDGYGGMLGNGTYGTFDCAEGCSSVPVPVSGHLQFSVLSAGGSQVCALTPDGTAYCWGLNDYGQLGSPRTLCNGWISGPPGDRWCSTTPVPVSGDLRFRAISTGALHTCGITTDGALYCWGSNYVGNLGVTEIGVGGQTEQPRRVASSVSFASLRAGERHNCAIATDGSAYCWGKGDLGNIGNGTREDALVPTAVAGGLLFKNVTVNVGTSCGITTGGTTYCWGVNAQGDGLGTWNLVPRRVAFQRP
jgi:alpha-tubulin suppressor-like RCC1 family protein